MKQRNWLVQSLGFVTTLISMCLIYLILFKDGVWRGITPAMAIEFATVLVITVSTKFFWYTSTESTIRSSDVYLEKRKTVTTGIENSIVDAKDFDDFIEVENAANYNKYILNHCGSITADNYRPSLFDIIHRMFYHKPKVYYAQKYIWRVENRANKLHKLSGPNIRALSHSSNGLTDDRNMAARKKITYLWLGMVYSFASMFFTAMIGFVNKEDIDIQYAVLKLAMYFSQILFAILQTILKARMTVLDEDLAYFNKIVSILEKYESYKNERYTVTKLSYILEGYNECDTSAESEKVIIDTCERSSESSGI